MAQLAHRLLADAIGEASSRTHSHIGGCVREVLYFPPRGSAKQDSQTLLTLRRGQRLLFSGRPFAQRDRMLRPLRDFACNGSSSKPVRQWLSARHSLPGGAIGPPGPTGGAARARRSSPSRRGRPPRTTAPPTPPGPPLRTPRSAPPLPPSSRRLRPTVRA